MFHSFSLKVWEEMWEEAMGRLTIARVKEASRAGRMGDGQGLYLLVVNINAKSWIVRIQKDGKRRDIGLGSALKVSLSDARKKAAKIRADIEAGIDPVIQRNRERGIPTFKEAAKLVFEQNRKTWKNSQHKWQWMRTLEMFAFPKIGDMAVSEVTGPMVRDLLAEIWLIKPETARRVRQRVGMVLDLAYSKGWRDAEAPMRSITKGLPKQPKSGQHHLALPYADVPTLISSIAGRPATSGRLALEFLILTAARSGEVRGANWAEIDLSKRVWTVPAERMKAGKAHVVPLSDEAIAALKKAQAFRSKDSDLIFPGQLPKVPLSDMTLLKVLRDMNVGVTVHGFRSSFRDWAAEETSYPGEVAEAALAHAIPNKVEAAYRRTDFLEKRKSLMNEWAALCSGK